MKNSNETQDDPVTGFTRCPLYVEAAQHLIVTYDTEPILRAAEPKISELSQTPSQRAI